MSLVTLVTMYASHSHGESSECGQVANVLHKEGINSTQQEHLMEGVEDPSDENIAFQPKLLCSSVRLKQVSLRWILNY